MVFRSLLAPDRRFARFERLRNHFKNGQTYELARQVAGGGLIVIHGSIVNADKTGPLPAAEYSSLLMNITQGKCYSVEEYDDFLRPHGFDLRPYQDTIGERGFLAASKR